MPDTIDIHVHDCVVPLFVGIYDREKPAPQPVVFHVNVSTPLTTDLSHATVDDVINYEKIFRFLTIELPKHGHTPLLENLGERVIAFCFKDPRIQRASVTLEKPEAFGGQAVVGITMHRERGTA